MHVRQTTFTAIGVGAHSSVNDSTTYSAKDRQTMASYIYIENTYSITYVAYVKDIYQKRYWLCRYFSTWEGLIMIVQTQLKVYAGNAPNATMK